MKKTPKSKTLPEIITMPDPAYLRTIPAIRPPGLKRRLRKESEKPISRIEAWLKIVIISRHYDTTFYKKKRKGPTKAMRKGRKMVTWNLKLKRGEAFFCESDLAKDWIWPWRKVHRFFQRLEKIGKIKQKKAYPGIGIVIKVIDPDKEFDAIIEQIKSDRPFSRSDRKFFSEVTGSFPPSACPK